MHTIKQMTNMSSIANSKEFTELSEKVDDLEDSVELLENRTGHIYGIKRSLTTTDATWERTNDAVDLVANATKDGTEVENDFDTLYPWSEMQSFNIDTETNEIKAWYGDLDFKFDGSNGDVYTHIPKFWYKIWQDDEYEYRAIADYPAKGFKESKEFDIARYLTGKGEDGKLHSYSGLDTTAYQNINTYRTEVKELGDNYCLMDYRYFILLNLFLVEYATFNSQEALGAGLTSMRHNGSDVALIAETSTNRFIVNTTAGNAFIVGQTVAIGKSEQASSALRTITEINDYSDDDGITGKEIVFDGDALDIATTNVIWSPAQKSGGCDSLGMKSGCLADDGKHANSYRGIENIFGNILAFVDGINIKDRVAYVCYTPSEYKSDVFETPYKALSYTNVSSNGYSKTLGFDEDNDLIRFPTEIGGSSTTGLTDYHWQNSGKRVARVGGDIAGGAGAGLWYWALNNGSSFAGWTCGARVLKYQ